VGANARGGSQHARNTLEPVDGCDVCERPVLWGLVFGALNPVATEFGGQQGNQGRWYSEHRKGGEAWEHSISARVLYLP
jgi:hypothetical protein